MNNKYDIEMGIDKTPSYKAKGRYDDEHTMVDVPLNDVQTTGTTWKKKLRNMHNSLVKGTLLSSEYTPVNIKLTGNSLPPRSRRCDKCIIS